MTSPRVLQLNPRDNVLVALDDLRTGDQIGFSGRTLTLCTDVPAKHKIAMEDVSPGLSTTGLGTPTGNPIAPAVKISTNSRLAQKMVDIIDIDTGSVVSGRKTIQQMGEEILDHVIQFASGEARTKAELLAQNDFIPWKRGVSL